MTHAGLDVFDTTVQKSNEWLNRLMELLHTENKHFAYSALRAVCHTLRDRLIPGEAAGLGAQLPMLLRGMYYEGWSPKITPIVERKADDFLEKVSDEIPRRPEYDAERIVRCVFTLLAERISLGEIDDIVGTLPRELKEFWPAQVRAA